MKVREVNHSILFAVAGTVLAAVAGGFVAARLSSQWDDARDAMAQASPSWLLLAAGLAVVAMGSIALGWWRVLRALGVDVAPGRAVVWFFVGEIGKYVPGGVWPIVGRGELATRGGVPRPVAYRSVAASLACLYTASVWVGPLVPLAVPRTRRWGAVAAGYLPTWVLVGLATWSVARALDPDAPLARTMVAASLSWLVGFLAVPVPGGVGVREAAFVAMAGGLAPGVAAATAVLVRLLFIATDVVAAVVFGPRAARR